MATVSKVNKQPSFLDDEVWDNFINKDKIMSAVFPIQLSQDPFAAFICGLGVDPVHNTLYGDHIHNFTGEFEFAQVRIAQDPEIKKSLRDYIDGIQVDENTLDLVSDIKEYYRAAMAQLKLSGSYVTPWRTEMLRVLDNCDKKIVQNKDDWRIMFKLYEFYYFDLQVDGITRDADSVHIFDQPTTVQTFKNVIPLHTMRSGRRSDKHSGVFDFYCRTELNTIVSVRISGAQAAMELAQLLVDTGTKFDITGACGARVSNGSQVAYYTMTNPTISVGEKH